ncbi:MAG TPA: GspE/PulE family protein [Opitutaceae bacterium]|nr:GspE/PulE family protein [Opitutaceae bacterium]
MTSEDTLIQLAIRRGLVSTEQVAGARARLAPRIGLNDALDGPLDLLRDEGALDSRSLAEFLAQQLGLPLAELAGEPIPAEILQLVPRALATRRGLLPLERDAGSLRVAVSDPFDTDGIDDVRYLTGLEVLTAVAPADRLRAAIADSYGPAPVKPGETEEPSVSVDLGSGRFGEGDGEEAPAVESDAPIMALVASIIEKAVSSRASDIHFEPLEKRFRVRFRIDGTLVETDSPPRRLQSAIVSRLKLMANISIAEKRVPQDGRIRFSSKGRSLDLRVASLPTIDGESIVMRVLDQEGLRPELAGLGFAPEERNRFESLIKHPDGLLLVTGPTGSGKTTTLYSALHHLNRSDRKILTVEDPVEYQLAGINQVSVRREIGMTFASALRAMLRQAPNIVMVGEIRDRETAGIAVSASLTGHMVLSTLHTNDAAGAIPRLVDLGVRPFSISTSLRGVLAQRLVRRNCPTCSAPYRPSAMELGLLGIARETAESAQFLRGGGCEACQGTGYHGRIGLFELMVVDDELRRRIHAAAPVADLNWAACAAGMRPLREDGVRKVIAGLTTIEEVVSITVDEGP